MSVKAYYNEWDKDAAAWLRQLIKDCLITDGEVDERSITEVEASDLVGFDRCHFFAGVGTWDYCLNEAGWGDRPVWTASLPCQPFSVAGKGLGKDDERHLLPHFLELVRQCKPITIFGEQVGAAIRHGWLDDLHAEMGGEGYTVGHVVYGAHSIGAAHIRQRLYWVAHSLNAVRQREIGRSNGAAQSSEIGDRENVTESGQSGGTDEHVLRLADSVNTRPKGRIPGRQDERWKTINGYLGRSGADSGMGHTSSGTSERTTRSIFSAENKINRERIEDGVRCNGYSDASEIDWIYCRDNKYRPIKSGLEPLVDGTTPGVVYGGDPGQAINADYSTEARAMRLKGYGNAIVAGCGIEFISAFMEVMSER